MSNRYLDDKETKKEWKEYIRNLMFNMDNITYNLLVLHYNGNFEYINRKELAETLNVNKNYIDYIIDCYAENDNATIPNYYNYLDKLELTHQHEDKGE